MRFKFFLVAVAIVALLGFALGFAVPLPSPAERPVVSVEPAATLSPDEYRYDPTVVSQDAKEYLGETDYAKYCQLIEAVRWAHESIPFASKKQYDKVVMVFKRFYLPMDLIDTSAGDTPVTLDETTLVGTIRYANDRDTHIQLNYIFEVIIEDAIRTNVVDLTDDVANAMKLYRYVADTTDYVEDHSISTYQTVLTKQGLCKNYSELYELLLNQIGITCYPAVSASHAWLMVGLDGQWYHMDPTFESSTSDGKGLRYFGMTDEERATSVDSEILYTPFGYYPNSQTNLSCTSTRFAPLHSDSYDSFVVDDATGAILLYRGKKVVYEFR